MQNIYQYKERINLNEWTRKQCKF